MEGVKSFETIFGTLKKVCKNREGELSVKGGLLRTRELEIENYYCRGKITLKLITSPPVAKCIIHYFQLETVKGTV